MVTSSRSSINGVVGKVLKELKRDYLVIGKNRLRGWQAWLLLGTTVGIVAGVVFIANQTGKFERSAAAVSAAALEAESGTLSGSSTIGSDSNASGGQYVQFGSGTAPLPSPSPLPPPPPPSSTTGLLEDSVGFPKIMLFRPGTGVSGSTLAKYDWVVSDGNSGGVANLDQAKSINPKLIGMIQPYVIACESGVLAATYGYSKFCQSTPTNLPGVTSPLRAISSYDKLKNLDGSIHYFSGTGTVDITNWQQSDTALLTARLRAHSYLQNASGHPGVMGVWGDNDFWSDQGYAFPGTQFNATTWDNGYIEHHRELARLLPGKLIGGNDLASMTEHPSSYRGTVADGWKLLNGLGQASMKEHFQRNFSASALDSEISGIRTFMGLKSEDGLQRYVLIGLDGTSPTSTQARLGLGVSAISGAYLWGYSGASGAFGTAIGWDVPEANLYGRNWLGLPKGDPVKISSGLWKRTFEKGLVIVNVTGSAKTVDGYTVANGDARFIQGTFADASPSLSVPYSSLLASAFSSIPTVTAAEAGIFFTDEEKAKIRSNVANVPWAKLAWQNEKALADAALSASPNPAVPRSPDVNVGWPNPLYQKGSVDGKHVQALSTAYLVTGDDRYAAKARQFLLAWARSYNPPPPTYQTGHDVAEPVGFFVRAWIAADIIRGTWPAAERTEFEAWAAKFVRRSEVVVENERDSFANNNSYYPWSNGPTWQRAHAVLAAMAVGGQTLVDARLWNRSFRSPGGRDGSFSDWIQNTMYGTGKMHEEEARNSISYALFNYFPAVLVAQADRSLYAMNSPNGNNLSKPGAYYAKYLAGATGPDWDTSKAAEKRAQFEIVGNAYPNLTDLENALKTGGDTQRGSNFDGRALGYGAVFGGLSGVVVSPPPPTPPPPPPPPTTNSYTIAQVAVAPTIDGNLAEFTNVSAVSIANASGNNGTYKLLWDNSALYVGVDVKDSQLNASITTRDGALWDEDSLEFAIDTLNNRGTSMGADDYKFFVNLLNTQRDEQGGTASYNTTFISSVQAQGTQNANADIDTGYTIEIKIPWSSIGLSVPTSATTFGLEIVMNDKDEASALQTAWSNTTGGLVNDPDGWGTGVFSTAVVSPSPTCPAPPTDFGSVRATVDIPAAATYTVWSRIMAPDGINNSYWLKVDDTCSILVGNGEISPNTWTWVNYQGGLSANVVWISLAQGQHTVELIGRESGVKLDRLIFTTDAVCTPVDAGTNCLPVSSPPPPPSTSTKPSVPTGLAATAGDKQVVLRWNANPSSDSIDSYQVYEADQFLNLNIPAASLTYTATTDYTGAPLVNGTTYNFRISAHNTAGYGDWTSAVSSMPTAPPPPPTAFNAKVNFQPSGTPIPSGYLPDYGSVYGSRGNGYTYGWNADNSANTRDRNSSSSADQRYDTLNHMQKNGIFTWEALVPNGTYTVRVVAGDASNYDSVYKISVEGVLTINASPASTSPRWYEKTVTVTVSDGRLTLGNATGASNNKINFIDIDSATVTAPPPPPADFIMNGLASSPGNLTAGQLVSFSATVQNQGSGAASVSSATRLRIDVDNNGTYDVLPANMTTGALAVAATEVETWVNAWTATAGTHLFEICADSASAVTEASESNNCATQTFIVSVPPPPPPPPTATNLAPNASFESDPNIDYSTVKDSGTGSTNFTWASDAAHTGSRSVKIVSTQSSGFSRWISQTGKIVVQPGKTYKLSLWLKTSNATSGARLSANFWNASKTYLGTTYDSALVKDTKDWTLQTLTLTAPSTAASLRIEFRLVGPGTAWADDVSVVVQ